MNTSNIDWGLLSEQKLCLIQIMAGYEGKTLERLTGILNLIDSIQDDAVDDGVPEEEVFHLKEVSLATTPDGAALIGSVRPEQGSRVGSPSKIC
jgi:hypothetical protein